MIRSKRENSSNKVIGANAWFRKALRGEEKKERRVPTVRKRGAVEEGWGRGCDINGKRPRRTKREIGLMSVGRGGGGGCSSRLREEKKRAVFAVIRVRKGR